MAVRRMPVTGSEQLENEMAAAGCMLYRGLGGTLNLVGTNIVARDSEGDLIRRLNAGEGIALAGLVRNMLEPPLVGVTRHTPDATVSLRVLLEPAPSDPDNAEFTLDLRFNGNRDEWHIIVGAHALDELFWFLRERVGADNYGAALSIYRGFGPDARLLETLP